MAQAKTAEMGGAGKPLVEFSSDAWVPDQPGDELQGKIVSVERAWSDYKNGFYPILRIETDTGEVKAFHAFRTVALSQVLAKRPTTGEVVKITYLGPRPPKPGDKGSPPVGYRLEIEGRGPEADERTYDSMETAQQMALESDLGEPDRF